MTEKKGKTEGIDVKALLAGDDTFIRSVVRTALQEVLEAEMTEAVGAAKGERTANGWAIAPATEPGLGLAIGQTRGVGR